MKKNINFFTYCRKEEAKNAFYVRISTFHVEYVIQHQHTTTKTRQTRLFRLVVMLSKLHYKLLRKSKLNLLLSKHNKQVEKQKTVLKLIFILQTQTQN